MAKHLHDAVLDALQARQTWEDKQRAYYTMRHDGLRRVKKPFPGASDLHYPLIDGQIEKAKPFYFGQVFGADLISEFEAESAETAAVADLAANYFDHYCKNRLPLGEKFLSASDTMLVRGRGIIKTFWNAIDGKVEIESVDPQYFIVPPSGVGPDEDDWFVHVKPMSEARYRRMRVYNTTPAVMTKILGGQHNDEAGGDAEDDKYAREGLTHTRDKGQIIVWELWEKTPGGWTIREYSPQAPEMQLRQPRGCAYKWRGKAWQPFVSMTNEVKDEGWYSPRGIAERLAPFELSLTRTWNEKHDFMAFANKPLFARGEGASPNTLNFRFRPGEVLPKGIEPVQMPSPPIQADQEMQFQRMVASDYINLPDAGTLPDAVKGSSSKDKTATQSRYEASLQTAATNLRGWVFREALAKVYQKIWALIVQYEKPAVEMAYFAKGRQVVLPASVFSDLYTIKPGGAIDGWDKERRHQKAILRKQMFHGDPGINQEELNKSVLETEDARLAERLIMPNGLKDANEAEDCAKEIVLMMEGFPAAVMPQDDHGLRIRLALGKLQQLNVKGLPVDEQAKALIFQYIATHLQFLQQQNPKLAQGALAAINQLSAQGDAGVMPSEAQPELAMAGGAA